MMGMFDWVTYEANCPICDQPLSGWQTKDAACMLDSLTPAQLWERSAAIRADRKRDALPFIFGEHTKFYTGCNGCGANIEIRLEPGFFDHTAEETQRILKGERVEYRRGPVLPGSDSQ